MDSDHPLITPTMWGNIITQAAYQVTVLLVLHFRGSSILGVSSNVKDALTFNTLVLCQVINAFNARKLEKNIYEGILKSKAFVGIMGLTVLLEGIMVVVFHRFASTERLSWGQWAACIGIASLSWPITWLVNCISEIIRSAPISLTDSNRYMKLLTIQWLKQTCQMVAKWSSIFVKKLKRGEWTILNSLLKCVQLQVTATFAWFTICLVNLLSSHSTPISTVQFMGVILVMGILSTLAFQVELMEKPPGYVFDPVLAPKMLGNVITQVAFQVTALLVLHFTGSSWFGVSNNVRDTLISNTFVLCQVSNAFNVRKLEEKNVFKGILNNGEFIGSGIHSDSSGNYGGDVQEIPTQKGSTWVNGPHASEYFTIMANYLPSQVHLRPGLAQQAPKSLGTALSPTV